MTCEAFCLDTLVNSRFFVALVVERFGNNGDEEGSVLLLIKSVVRPTKTTTRESKLTMDLIQRGLCFSLLIRHVAAAEVIVADCRF